MRYPGPGSTGLLRLSLAFAALCQLMFAATPTSATEHAPQNAEPGKVNLTLLGLQGGGGDQLVIHWTVAPPASSTSPNSGHPYSIAIYLDGPAGDPIYFTQINAAPDKCTGAFSGIRCDTGKRGINDPAAAYPLDDSASVVVRRPSRSDPDQPVIVAGSTMEIVVQGFSVNTFATIPLASDGFDPKPALSASNADYDRDLEDCEKKFPPHARTPFFSDPFGILLPALWQSCLGDARRNYYRHIAEIDPPDARFTEVALPRPFAAPAPGRTCRSGPRGARRNCARFVARSTARGAALNDVAAITRGMYETMNRRSGAFDARDLAGARLQDAALKALAGELVNAQRTNDAAAARFAAPLESLQPTRLTRRQAKARLGALRRGDLPAQVLRALRADGISKADVAAAYTAATKGVKAGPVDVGGALRSRSDVAKLRAAYRTLTPDDLAALVGGVAAAGGLNESQRQALAADAEQVRMGGGAASAVKFVADAKAIPGEAGRFLSTAGQALAGG